MTLKELVKVLDEISPFDLQEDWDNCGLLIGEPSFNVENIVLSLDIDEALIDNTPEDSVLVTHHPLIFSGLKQLNFSKYPANLIQKMIKKNISHIAMHTNFDKTHLNRYVGEKILGFEVIETESFVLKMRCNMSFEKLIKHLENKLGLQAMKVVSSKDYIETIALTTGSGASLLSYIDADCFLTGDIKYHDAMTAKSLNLALIEIGHFESERFFAEVLAESLKNISLNVIISNSKNPFTYDKDHLKDSYINE